MEQLIETVRFARQGLRSGDLTLYANAQVALHEVPPEALRNVLFDLMGKGELSEHEALEILLTANEKSLTEFVLREAKKLDEHFRFTVCLICQEWPRSEALEVLQAWAQSDPDVDVRAEACWALSEIPSLESEQVLSQITSTDHALDYEGTAISHHAAKALEKLRIKTVS